MAEALVISVLQKIGESLAGSAISTITSKLVEDISALREVDDSMKKIQSEFVVMRAYISQVYLHKTNNKTFEAWLEQLRMVAYEVEDTVDEYTYLTGQQQTSGMIGFIRKTFAYSRKNAALRDIADQLKKLEGRFQNLTSMKYRYSISITEKGGSSNANYEDGIVSESPYFSSEDDIVGFGEETEQLLKWLTDEKQGRAIISICGMGGLGKTTLARSMYKNEKIKRHFACCAWVSVSQNYQVDDLFRRIAKELLEKIQATPSDIDTMDHNKLAETLQSRLQGRRYLIVLDDVWKKDAWLVLKHAFVENNCGSRVVITTRSKDVALLADEDCQMKLTTLPEEEAWDLFCKKAFGRLDENRCPETLKYWAEKIVEKCQGLALAIVAIGSLLAYKEKKEEEWRSFYDQLNWQLDNNPELNWVAHRVLDLSFMDLPGHLKNCFLYCGLFPEDYRFYRDWIIRLWIAEGFIEERGPRMTMEEVGEVYINELVHRCLLQVVERDEFGRVYEFQIHDVVREITATKSRKEMFGNSHDNTGTIQLGDEARRVFINRGSEIILQPSTGSRQLRSFLLFDRQLSSSCIHNVSSSFKLLRVLSLRGANIDRVPAAVAELFNLRYLDLAHTKVKNIPRSLGKLLNLQTLDFSYARVSKLPKEVSMLQKLRHLFMVRINVSGSLDYTKGGASVPDEICSIRSLQSLYGIEASRVLVQKIGNLTLLKVLIITKMRRRYCEALCASLANMLRLRMLLVFASDPSEILNLEKLRPLPSLQYMDLNGRLEIGAVSSSIFFSSFENLRILRMGWSRLCEDPLPALSTMSNLVTLNLFRAYDGQGLAFHTGWFPKLKTLRLFSMPQLVWIDIKDGTMKNLQELYLSSLPNLGIVPEGIKYLKSIQKMYLWGMAEDFIDRVKGTDWEIVEHIPNINW